MVVLGRPFVRLPRDRGTVSHGKNTRIDALLATIRALICCDAMRCDATMCETGQDDLSVTNATLAPIPRLCLPL